MLDDEKYQKEAGKTAHRLQRRMRKKAKQIKMMNSMEKI